MNNKTSVSSNKPKITKRDWTAIVPVLLDNDVTKNIVTAWCVVAYCVSTKTKKTLAIKAKYSTDKGL